MQWKPADTRSSGEKEWQKKNYSFFLRLSVLSVTSFSILLMCLRVFNSIENLGYLKKILKEFKIHCLFKKHKHRKGKGGEWWMYVDAGSRIAERASLCVRLLKRNLG